MDNSISSKKREEVDIKAYRDIFRKCMGYDRENDIRVMLTRWPHGR
jgi:hypothetical protein